ncbi:MAG TPA: hypothetical protein VGJ15_04355 [Pirellulales bacterium]|jgi:hypothetical protein
MKPEKILIIGVACVVLAIVGKLGFDFVYGMMEDRQHQLDGIEKRISENQTKVNAGRKAAKQISEWEQRSLPSDRTRAPRLYSNWLIDLASRSPVSFANLDVGQLTGGGGRNSNEKLGYEVFSFEVKGEIDPSLKQLVQFMYEFYASNQLHKIRTFSVSSVQNDHMVEVKLQVEAMLLSAANRKEDLADAKLAKLGMGDLAYYEKTIGDRKLFAEYKAPPPDPGPRGGRPEPPVSRPEPFDVAKFAEVTGITGDSDAFLLWINVKTTGQKFQLKEGQDFKIGDVTYKVMRIGLHDADVVGEGKRHQMHIGDNLRDAPFVTEPVETEAPAKDSL